MKTCAALHHGEFESNGVAHSFGAPSEVRWGDSVLPGRKHSRWHHDLSFFIFAIPLIADDPERGLATTATMLCALESQLADDASELQRFHWSPIAIATRILALTSALALLAKDVLAANAGEVQTIGSHIWRCVAMLETTVERYLGYNHAATTEAGLAVGLILLGRHQDAQSSGVKLVQVLDVSTTTDGMWSERSPSYHICMLVLADGGKELFQAGSMESRRLHQLTQLMRSALSAVVHPDGEIAIFNDSAIADSPAPGSVGWSRETATNNLVLPVGGYARLARGGITVIFDAGPMGPDSVIGHGHADFLSIEVSVGDTRLIVDPGVASISGDDDRRWTRSAASHNGPRVAGAEPAEFFGTWRVGRRGSARFTAMSEDLNEGSDTSTFVSGECNGYSHLGVGVSRKVTVTDHGELHIEDRWTGVDAFEPATSFLVPLAWSVEEHRSTRLVMSHADGAAVELSVAGGRVADVVASRYFPEGPMGGYGATCVHLAPTDHALVTTIRTMGRTPSVTA
ncbi:heparinase II/III family protein [Mycolicibacterium sp. PDY-3]|uniref:heparinase II/III domain-containing protein n=1 Tax=Mycolicibacterium sp. PDY-3 TaxID=3376069 RepID=UPI0037B57D72